MTSNELHDKRNNLVIRHSGSAHTRFLMSGINQCDTIGFSERCLVSKPVKLWSRSHWDRESLAGDEQFSVGARKQKDSLYKWANEQN